MSKSNEWYRCLKGKRHNVVRALLEAILLRRAVIRAESCIALGGSYRAAVQKHYAEACGTDFK